MSEGLIQDSSDTSLVRDMVTGTAVAVEGRALLIQGPSGSGKSALALEMLCRGASLVGDDKLWADREGERLILSAPDATKNVIEARGLGLLSCPCVKAAMLVAVVDLCQPETQRLPEFREINLFELKFPLLHKVESGHFPAALIQYLKGGRLA